MQGKPACAVAAGEAEELRRYSKLTGKEGLQVHGMRGEGIQCEGAPTQIDGRDYRREALSLNTEGNYFTGIRATIRERGKGRRREF